MIERHHIMRLRRDYGWTVDELAKLLNVKPRTVQGWESGKLIPKKKEEAALWKLWERYRWPTADFFEELTPQLKAHCGSDTIKSLAAKHGVPDNALLRFAELVRECSGRYDEHIIDLAEQRDLFEGQLRKVLSRGLSDELAQETEELLSRYQSFQNINHGFPTLFKELKQHQLENVEIFSRANEKARELLVVEALCLVLGSDRYALRTNDIQQHIVDVYWHGEGFQVKELTSGKRGDEQKAKLESLEIGRSMNDAFSTEDSLFNREVIEWPAVLRCLRDLLEEKGYSEAEKANTNLVVYFTKRGEALARGLTESDRQKADELGWKSVSFLDSQLFTVLSARPSSPEWLRTAVGHERVLSFTELEQMWRFEDVTEVSPNVLAVRRPKPPKQSRFF